LMWMNRTKPKDSTLNFEERATQMGLLNPNRFGWGAAMVDLDLDGRLDLVQANGMVADDWDKQENKCLDYWYLNEKLARSPPAIHSYSDAWADIRGACIFGNETDRVYINNGKEGFSDVAMSVGLTDSANTRGVAPVDLDNDGDLDLVITDQFGAPKIYENQLPHDRRWLGLDLSGNGTTCNSDAVGTKVWIAYGPNQDPQQQYREVRLSNGFSAQGDKRIVFGLGQGNTMGNTDVSIQWCGRGPKQLIKGLILNEYHILQQN